MKRPAFQFYPGDWMRDSALRSCSVGARGLWMDMICLMHEGTPYGYLKVNLKVILPANLARMVGATLEEVDGWIGELEGAGVFSRDEEGAIYSRRMIRDENIREARASGGKLGGNPALKDKAKVADKVILPANLKPTPSYSSSPSSANTNTPLPPKGGDLPLLAAPEDEPRVSGNAPPPKAKGPLQLRAERLMRRRESTPLTHAETRAFVKNRAAIEATTEDDWQALERFYAAPQAQTYARKDLAALLNNWNGEIDRAKAWMGQAPAGTPVKAFVSPEPPNWRAIIDREFPKSDYANITTPWAKLTTTDRDCITQAIAPYLTAA